MSKKTIKGLDYPLKPSKKLQAALKPGNKTGNVAVMSPKEFLEHANRLPKTKEDRLLIDAFKGQIKKGEKFKALKLLADNRADGRHRATAAEELGIKEVPVIDYRESGLTRMKGVHAVGKNKSGVGKVEKEMRKERASGGSVPTIRPLGGGRDDAYFRRLINWSFAVSPLMSHKDGGPYDKYYYPKAGGGEVGRHGYATEGSVGDIDAAIRAANEVASQKAMEHEKGFSGNVEFAPMSLEEPLTGAKLPLGSYPKGTTETIEPALNTAAHLGAYAVPYYGQAVGAKDLAESTKELSSPEFKKAVEEGDYKTAGGYLGDVALSTLGLPGKTAKALAIGASAFMPSEAEAGPISKALDVARRLTESGHYSPAAEAAAAMKQEKGPASQMLGALKNLPGVKPEELKWSGIEGAFQPNEPVTRQQIMDYLHENVPQIKETTLGKDRINLVQNEEEPHIFEVYHAGDPEGQHYGQVGEIVQNPAGRYTVNVPGLSRHNFATVDEAREYINRASDIGSTTKYHGYTLPGGENYREVLMHFPEKNSENKPLHKVIQNDSGYFQHVDENGRVRGTYEDQNLAQQVADLGNKINSKKENNYYSSHWTEPNVLGHLRMSDRTGPEGEKILHLEEMQSDWGQAGRKHGFGKSLSDNWELKEQEPGFYHLMKKGSPTIHASGDINKVMKEAEQYGAVKEGLPAAPYVTNTQHWTDLGLKRALREAAEGGYDKMIWTPGAEQAARYDLSKSVGRIAYNPETKKLDTYDLKLKPMGSHTVEPNKLSDFIGKEAADKIMSAEPNNLGIRQLQGEGLRIGGEQMKSFYDKIVPNRLKSLLKNLGHEGQIEMSHLPGKESDYSIVSAGHPMTMSPEYHVRKNNEYLGKGSVFSDEEEAKKYMQELQAKEDKPKTIPSVKITPELRKRILEGLPAYAEGGAAEGEEAKSPGLVDRALNFVSQFNPVGTAEAGPVHASTVWKKWWENLAPVAREYENRPMAQRGLLTQFPIERVDQEMVDRVMAEQEAHKRKFGWKKGGKVTRRRKKKV